MQTIQTSTSHMQPQPRTPRCLYKALLSMQGHKNQWGRKRTAKNEEGGEKGGWS